MIKAYKLKETSELPADQAGYHRMGGHKISGSFDLFCQHCLPPTLNPVHHTKTVYDKLQASIMALPKKRRHRLQTLIIKLFAILEMEEQPP